MTTKGNRKDTAEKTETRSTAQVVERVQHFVALATNNESEEEARNAAMKAIELMKEHDLAFVPRSDLEKVRTAVEGAERLATRAKQEKMQNMLIGGALGLLLGKNFKIL